MNPLVPIASRPDDEPLVCIKVNKYWLAFLIAAVYPNRYPEAWLGTLEENRQARRDVLTLIDMFMNEMECEDMACCDGSDLVIVVLTHVTIDGKIEISIDGGDTWTPSPDDPRYSIPQLPPITSTSNRTKCDAATNALQHMKDAVAAVAETLDTFTTVEQFAIDLAAVVFEVLLVALGAGGLAAIVPLVASYFSGLAGMQRAAFEALFTSDVWDVVLCALYCHIGENGQFTQGGLSQVIADLRVKIAGFATNEAPEYTLEGILIVWGVIGTNQSASFGAASLSDCSDCACVGCDFSTWSVSVGSLVSQSETEIIGDAVAGEAGLFYLGFKSGGINECCCNVELEHISGAVTTVRGYNPCGLDNSTSENYGYAYTGQPANAMVFSAPGAFRLRIYSTAPCE